MGLSVNFRDYHPVLIKREPFFQKLDELGAMPLIGSISAIARILVGGFISFKVGIKGALSGSSKLSLESLTENSENFLAKDIYRIQGKCALHEVARGLIELFPTLINIIQRKVAKDETALLRNVSKKLVHGYGEIEVRLIFGGDWDWLARKDVTYIDPAGQIHYFAEQSLQSSQRDSLLWEKEHNRYYGYVPVLAGSFARRNRRPYFYISLFGSLKTISA